MIFAKFGKIHKSVNSRILSVRPIHEKLSNNNFVAILLLKTKSLNFAH